MSLYIFLVPAPAQPVLGLVYSVQVQFAKCNCTDPFREGLYDHLLVSVIMEIFTNKKHINPRLIICCGLCNYLWAKIWPKVFLIKPGVDKERRRLPYLHGFWLVNIITLWLSCNWNLELAMTTLAYYISRLFICWWDNC